MLRIGLIRVGLLACVAMQLAHARAETRLEEARFVLDGAQHSHFYGTTGTVTVVLPPGVTTTTEPLLLSRDELHTGIRETTAAVYDPATTFSANINVANCAEGTSYYTCRMLSQRKRAWISFSRLGGQPELNVDTTAATQARYREMSLRRMNALFDTDTTGTWLGNSPTTDFHWSREDAYYAWALLDAGGTAEVERANDILQNFAVRRDTTTGSFTHGAFFTNSTDSQLPDQSCTFFTTSLLARLLLEPHPQITSETTALLNPAVTDAAYYLLRELDTGYPADHTNFYALAIAGMHLAGKLSGDQVLMNAAQQYLDIFYARVITHGATFECNSPVYNGVTIWALALLRDELNDAIAASKCDLLSQRLWMELALNYYKPIEYFAGAYSRSYEDGLRGGTGLSGLVTNVRLSRPAYLSSGRIAENFAAEHSLDLNPAAFLAKLPGVMETEILQCFDDQPLPSASYQRTPFQHFTTCLAGGFSLGTIDKTRHSQNEPLVIQVPEANQPAGFSTVFARCGATSDPITSYGGTLRGTQFAVQSGNRAIYMADSDIPVEQSPAKQAFLTLIADERFSTWSDLRINGTTAALPHTWQVGEKFFARRANAYLAVEPLYAHAIATRDRVGAIERGEGHLNLKLFAADSATTLPLAGARVEAAFAVRCEEADAWSSYDAFIQDHLAQSQAQVIETPTSRSIQWQLGDALACTYDRTTRAVTSSTLNQAPITPAEMAKSEFYILLPGAGGSATIRDLVVSNLPGYSWVVYPHGSQTALISNPTSQVQAISHSWSGVPAVIPPFSFARIQKTPSTITNWKAY